MVRCSSGCEALELWRELPAWMFDRAACAPMRVEAGPQVDVGALEILRVLLNEVAGAGAAAGIVSSNALVLGVPKVSHDQNWGEADATPTEIFVTNIRAEHSSSICSHGARRQQRDTRGRNGRRCRTRRARR